MFELKVATFSNNWANICYLNPSERNAAASDINHFISMFDDEMASAWKSFICSCAARSQ